MKKKTHEQRQARSCVGGSRSLIGRGRGGGDGKLLKETHKQKASGGLAWVEVEAEVQVQVET